jgi:hypothetical protein
VTATIDSEKLSQEFFMGKAKKQRGVVRKEQVRQEKLADTEARIAQLHKRQTMQKCKTVIMQNDRTNEQITFHNVDKICEYSSQELFNFLQIEGKDMSHTLKRSIREFLELFQEQQEKFEFHLYMRSHEYVKSFVTLQRCIEESYDLKNTEELYGWILQYGPYLFMGSCAESLDSLAEFKDRIGMVREYHM